SRWACPRRACPSGAAGSTSASPCPYWPRLAPSRRRPSTVSRSSGNSGWTAGYARSEASCRQWRPRRGPGLARWWGATRKWGGGGSWARGGGARPAARAALLAWLRGERDAEAGGMACAMEAPEPPPAGPAGTGGEVRVRPSLTPGRRALPRPDLSDVLGQPVARRAAEICAAGGHHLSLLGPPGAGKTMLADRLPTVMPLLDRAAALEVPSIHSVAGTLPVGSPLMTEPPFCAPHHTATKAAIVGGGSGILHPGAASLAHCGCLFL